MNSSSNTNPIIGFLWSLVLLLLLGGVLVVFSVMMGKYELLVIVFAVLGATALQHILSPKWQEKLEEVPIIGEVSRLYRDLETYYETVSLPSPLFYIFFPLTGVIAFFQGKEARKELKTYFHLTQWVLAVLFIEGGLSYTRYYGHLSSGFTLHWIFLELACIYLLVTLFLVSILSTSIHFRQTNQSKRFFASTLVATSLLLIFAFSFLQFPQYRNAIPVQLLQKERLHELSQRIAQNETKEKKRSIYFDKLRDATKMFLTHYIPRIQEFQRQRKYRKSLNTKLHSFYEMLNESFQEHIMGISRPGEAQQYFLTTTQRSSRLTGIVLVPRQKVVYFAFQYERGHLELFQRWSKMPKDLQQSLKNPSPNGLYSAHLPFLAQKLLGDGLLLDHLQKNKHKKNVSLWFLLGIFLSCLSLFHVLSVMGGRFQK